MYPSKLFTDYFDIYSSRDTQEWVHHVPSINLVLHTIDMNE